MISGDIQETLQLVMLRKPQEEGLHVFSDALLGKEAMEALPPPLPAPAIASSLPATPLLSAHSKTGSRDSCTQTERSPETQRATSIAGRSRLGNTPSGSPVLRHTLPRGGPESTGETWAGLTGSSLSVPLASCLSNQSVQVRHGQG